MKFFRRHTGTIFGITLCIISVLLILFPFPEGTKGAVVKRTFLVILSPIQKLIVSFGEDTRSLWERMTVLRDAAEENREMKKLLERISTKYDTLKTLYIEAEQKNRRLEELLGLREESPYELLPARVIGRDPALLSTGVLIDRGSKDHITTEMPVISVGGIVGIVIEVSDESSEIMLINDKKCRVDVIFQENRARGVLEGAADGSLCVSYVDRAEEIQTGDIVITSGMDGIFPKGMPVGEVGEVKKHGSGIFQTIILSPAVDLTRLEEVLIIMGEKK
jgi:rod shape-determining protein MreC